MKGKKKRILLIILVLVLIIIMSIFYINKKDVLVSRVKGIGTKNMNSDNTMHTITLDHTQWAKKRNTEKHVCIY